MKQKGIYFEEGSPTQNIIRSLNLSKTDLKRLKRRFVQIDVDGSGAIDMEEFFSIFKEKATPYSKALFELSGEQNMIPKRFLLAYATHASFSLRHPPVLIYLLA
jgi:hypothetical protein